MGVFDGILPGNDPRMERLLKRRIAGDERQASHESRNAALSQARANAASTAARGSDAGLPPALAQRMASQQLGASTNAANAQFSRDRRQEVAQAEQGLAEMKAQRGAFMRQLLGKGMQTAGAMVGKLGMTGGQGGAALPGGRPMAMNGNRPAGSPGAGPGTHTGAGNPLLGILGGGGGGGGLGALGSIAGTAVGGPLGGMVGGQLGGILGGGGAVPTDDQLLSAHQPPPPPQTPVQAATTQAVQQATSGLDAVAQSGALPPGSAAQAMGGQVVDPNGPPPDDPDAFLTWLMLRGGR